MKDKGRQQAPRKIKAGPRSQENWLLIERKTPVDPAPSRVSLGSDCQSVLMGRWFLFSASLLYTCTSLPSPWKQKSPCRVTVQTANTVKELAFMAFGVGSHASASRGILIKAVTKRQETVKAYMKSVCCH